MWSIAANYRLLFELHMTSVSFLCALEHIHTYLGVRTLFVRVAFLFAVVAFLKFPDIVASHPLLPLKTSLVCIPSLWAKQPNNKTKQERCNRGHVMTPCTREQQPRTQALHSGFCLTALEKIRNGDPGFKARGA